PRRLRQPGRQGAHRLPVLRRQHPQFQEGHRPPIPEGPHRPRPEALPTMKPTDVRIEDVSYSTEDHRYRTPIKFGGVALDRVTLLNAEVVVRTGAGKVARGFGSMPLGNVWSFPSRVLTYDDTLGAMKALAGKLRDLFASCTEEGHAIDIGHLLETEY